MVDKREKYSSYVISIIVPVYNAEKNLKKCIESMLNQTYKSIELILVNDGSSDDSGEICDSYKDRKNVVIIHQQNSGVSTARNTGLEYARGEYIQFVDSDDYIDIDMCEKLIRIIKNNNADLAVCGFKEIYTNKVKNVVYFPKIYKSLTALDNDFIMLYKNCFFSSSWNKLYKKKLINKGFDEAISLGEDLLFNLSYFSNCEKIVVSKDELYNYVRENDNSLSVKYRNNKFDIATLLLHKINDFYDKEIAGNNKKVIYNMYMQSVFYAIQELVFMSKKSFQEQIKKISTWISTDEVVLANKMMDEKNLQLKIINPLIKFKCAKLILLFFLFKKIIKVFCLKCNKRR